MSHPPVSTSHPLLNEMMRPMPSMVPATAKGIVATMSSSAVSRSSISMQRGDEMSSRLKPPKVGAKYLQVAMICSTSCVSKQMGNASTPPNSLNSRAFPSITGSAAFGPMFPSPKTAEPSVITATVLRRMVKVNEASGSAWIALQILATPGVYAMERSSRVFTGTFELTSILPPRCIKNVRSDTFATRTPGMVCTCSTIRCPWSTSRALTVMSRVISPCCTFTMSTAPMKPSASPMAEVIFPNCPG